MYIVQIMYMSGSKYEETCVFATVIYSTVSKPAALSAHPTKCMLPVTRTCLHAPACVRTKFKAAETLSNTKLGMGEDVESSQCSLHWRHLDFCSWLVSVWFRSSENLHVHIYKIFTRTHVRYSNIKSCLLLPILLGEAPLKFGQNRTALKSCDWIP